MAVQRRVVAEPDPSDVRFSHHLTSPARPSRRKGRRARTMGMMAAAVRAAAMTPIVLLEWSAIAPYAIGANPPAPMTPV